MFTSAKVGECTRSVTPSPRAAPRTNWVLPAPRSPLSPTTQPVDRVRAKAAAISSVSTGLCEMCVTMRGQRPDALLIPQVQTGTGRNPADAAQFDIRKPLLPAVQQRHGFAAGNGEEKFEV